MAFIKVGPYHVKSEYIQYLKEDSDHYVFCLGEGAHAQTVSLTKEDGTALLQVLNDLGGLT